MKRILLLSFMFVLFSFTVLGVSGGGMSCAVDSNCASGVCETSGSLSRCLAPDSILQAKTIDSFASTKNDIFTSLRTSALTYEASHNKYNFTIGDRRAGVYVGQLDFNDLTQELLIPQDNEFYLYSFSQGDTYTNLGSAIVTDGNIKYGLYAGTIPTIAGQDFGSIIYSVENENAIYTSQFAYLPDGSLTFEITDNQAISDDIVSPINCYAYDDQVSTRSNPLKSYCSAYLSDGRIVVYNPKASTVDYYTTSATAYTNEWFNYNAPLIADLNNDGNVEVFAVDNDLKTHKIISLSSGSVVSDLAGENIRTASIGDLGSLGRVYCASGFTSQNTLNCYNYAGTNVLTHTSSQNFIPYDTFSLDIDGDGSTELVLSGFGSATHIAYLYKYDPDTSAFAVIDNGDAVSPAPNDYYQKTMYGVASNASTEQKLILIAGMGWTFGETVADTQSGAYNLPVDQRKGFYNYYVIDVDGDGNNDLLQHGEDITRIYTLNTLSSDDGLETIPIQFSTGLSFSGIYGYYYGDICAGTNITFEAQECGVGVAKCNYFNSAGDNERLLSNCGGEQALGGNGWSSSNPSVTCQFNTTGQYDVKIYLQAQSDPDFDTFNDPLINITVVNGVVNQTCNVYSDFVTDPFALQVDDAGFIEPEVPTQDPVLTGDLFNSDGTINDSAWSSGLKTIIGLGVLLFLIISFIKTTGITNAFIVSIVGIILLFIVTAIGLLSWYFSAFIGMFIILILIGKQMFNGGGV